MTDVYRVGVVLSLTNNVSAGLRRARFGTWGDPAAEAVNRRAAEGADAS